MSDQLPFHDLEKVYELMAAAIDEVGAEDEALFLSKLCLTLAHNIRDITTIEAAVDTAKQHLNR